jgi:hypothetical protein
MHYDTPPSSLMDSTASPKVKTTKGKGVGARSLARSTLGAKGRAATLGWDYKSTQGRKMLLRWKNSYPQK